MKETKELIIDPEFASQIPPLDPEEYEKLEASILEERALISPIVLWNGIIVDGYHRYKIMQDHPEVNIRYTVYEKDFPDRDSVQAWICNNQLGRRNLTPEQKRYLIGEQYKAEKASHGGKRSGKRGENGRFTASVQKEHLRSKTRKQIAEQNHVSDSYVQRAEKYAESVDLADQEVPGVRKEILSTKITPTIEEMTQILKTEDSEERKGLIAQLYEKKPASHSISKKKKGGGEKPCELNKRKKEPGTHANIQAAKTILDNMTQSDGKASEDDVIYELKDALDSMMYRWSSCIEMNPEAASGKSYQKRCDELIEKGIKFLCDFKNS